MNPIIDNSEQLFKLMGEDNPNIFYHCQIILRGKDHPDGSAKHSARLIKSYFFKGRSDAQAHLKEIKHLCDYYGARAYLNLSLKTNRSFQLGMLQEITDKLQNGQEINPRVTTNSIAGTIYDRNYVWWVVDVDDITKLDEVSQYIDKLHKEGGSVMKGTHIVKTLNGAHLLARPFNLKAFKDKYSDIDVHKNSCGTLLYCPNFEKDNKEDDKKVFQKSKRIAIQNPIRDASKNPLSLNKFFEIAFWDEDYDVETRQSWCLVTVQWSSKSLLANEFVMGEYVRPRAFRITYKDKGTGEFDSTRALNIARNKAKKAAHKYIRTVFKHMIENLKNTERQLKAWTNTEEATVNAITKHIKDLSK